MPPVPGPSISPELQLAGGIVLMEEFSSQPSVPVEISSLATGIYQATPVEQPIALRVGQAKRSQPPFSLANPAGACSTCRVFNTITGTQKGASFQAPRSRGRSQVRSEMVQLFLANGWGASVGLDL